MSDLIRREDAIEAVASADETNGTVKVFTGRQVNGILSALPSADAVQGEWTNEDGKPITDKFSVYCSRCKRWSEYRTNYCGHCGAKMGGG